MSNNIGDGKLKVKIHYILVSQLEVFLTRSSHHLQPEEIVAIEEETGFTKPQIERLYSRFSSLDKQGRGCLTREDFLRIPELAINPLGDRIVHAFFYESKNTEEDKVDFTVSNDHC